MSTTQTRLMDRAMFEFKTLCNDTHATAELKISFTSSLNANVPMIYRLTSRPPVVFVPEDRVFPVLEKFHRWIDALMNGLGVVGSNDEKFTLQFWIRTTAGKVGFYWNPKQRALDDLYIPHDGSHPERNA